MTSNINTNSINTSYPTPGVNNSTQGFRDNFTSIKNNLDSAGTEISDLQNKVIVKSGLSGIPLNNNMANTLISNAAVRGFRATTYNLSDNIPSSITIDVSKSDVQYGTIRGNTIINFGGWSPSGTASSIKLLLDIANADAYISFPSTIMNSSNVVSSGMGLGCRFLENYHSNVADADIAAGVSFTNILTVPTGAQELNFTFSTTDCGSTIDVMPEDRNQKASQITVRTPTATGLPGDVAGQVCSDNSYLYVCVGSYDGTTHIWGKIALSGM